MKRGDRVRVRMGGRRRFRLAVLTSNPRTVSNSGATFQVVRFAYVTHGTQDQVGSETLSRHDHVAVIGADEVSLESETVIGEI